MNIKRLLRAFVFSIVVLTFVRCKSDEKQINDTYLYAEFNNIEDIIENFLEDDFPENWFERNKTFILEDNPDFKIENFDSLNYLIVPAINIPVDELEGYESGILRYLDKGDMSVYNGGELLIFENDTLQLKFTIRSKKKDGALVIDLRKSDFNDYLQNTQLSLFTGSDVYFNVNLVDGKAIFSLPTGTFIGNNNNYSVVMPAGKVYDVSEMYKHFFKSQDELDQYIQNIVSLVLRPN